MTNEAAAQAANDLKFFSIPRSWDSIKAALQRSTHASQVHSDSDKQRLESVILRANEVTLSSRQQKKDLSLTKRQRYLELQAQLFQQHQPLNQSPSLQRQEDEPGQFVPMQPSPRLSLETRLRRETEATMQERQWLAPAMNGQMSIKEGLDRDGRCKKQAERFKLLEEVMLIVPYETWFVPPPKFMQGCQSGKCDWCLNTRPFAQIRVQKKYLSGQVREERGTIIFRCHEHPYNG